MPASASANPAAARAQASKAKLNPLWWQYACATILAALVVGNALRWLFLDGADPYKCGGLMTQGQWMDPGTYKQWQPEGCFHSKLKHHAYFQCLSTGTSNTPVRLAPPHKRVVTFIGDSTVRQLFYGVVRLVDGGKQVAPRDWANEGEKHSDKRVTFYEEAGTPKERAVELEFLWDPYLNSTKTHELLHSTSIAPNPSALLVMGSGLWYLRNPDSGGLSAWGEMIHSTFESFKIAQGSPSSPLQNPWDTLNARSGLFGSSHAGSVLDHSKRQLLKPSSTSFSLSDAIIFLPVVDAVQSRLSPARAQSIQHTDIEAMNADLLARLAHPDPPPIVLPTVFNEMLPEEETTDGLHFSDKIMDQQAQILLGWRCNDVLKESGASPQGACCKRYRWVRPMQGLLVLLLAVWAPMGVVLGSRLAPSSPLQSYLPPTKLAAPLSTFGLAVVYLFFADRTTLMYLENKVYDAKVVGAIMGGFLLLGLGTLKNAGKDGGFLGRDVTDEWKGWMQIAILIYHFFGASKISGIYNPIRVMVAAYLFMTGYGHFFFYYKKADFGFLRVCSVLVRLNLLSVVLPYTMNTDYAFYYFAPLVSWWYLIIYGTMAIGARYNQTTLFLLPKLILMAGLVTAFMHFPILLESIFSVLHTVFRIQWSASEWSFRVSLDLFIVWTGMFSAFAYIKIKEHGIPEKPFFPAVRTASIAAAGLGMIWFAWFELRHDKFDYNGYHPYVSTIPVLSFVILRNATPILRSTTSTLFQFIGQCSLETFVLQFHGWLASDTKAILLVLPATRWRVLNIVLSTAAFVWLSHVVARATGELTDYIVKGNKKKDTGLPRPATASAPSGAAALATESKGDAQGDIPLGSMSEKGGKDDVREEERLLAEEMGATPAAAEGHGLQGSWPSWMANTAASFSSRKSIHAFGRPAGHGSSGVGGFFAKMGALAEEYLAAKMLMILGGLWALNWLY